MITVCTHPRPEAVGQSSYDWHGCQGRRATVTKAVQLRPRNQPGLYHCYKHRARISLCYDTDMSQPRVAVLRGGASREYEVSMKTGAAVLRSLAKLQYPAKDIVITRNDEWLDGGKVRTPELTLTGIDVVFIALHGEHGEDGRVQRFLTHHCMPYTGSRALASATALNKSLTKELLAAQGVKTPIHQTLRASDAPLDLATITDRFGERVVVKPAASGSSIDTYVGITPARVLEVLPELLEQYESVLLEEYVTGREVTVGLLEGFRDTPHYLMPVIEILPPESHDFYSYEAKYGGETRFECPGRISKKEQQALQDITATVHTALDLRQYSRSDFILQDGEPYFLEVNTLPGLTEHSLFPQALQAVGSSHEALVDHLIQNAAH